MQVGIKTGMNHIEYVDTLMGEMGLIIQRIESRGGMASPNEVLGLQNMAQHIAQHIAIIAMDKNEKQRVKMYGDALGKMMNMVKAYQQRIQQAMMKRAQQGNGGVDAETQAKIQAMMMQAQAKAANTRESHAQRTAQRQATFEMQTAQKAQSHAQEMRMQQDQNAIDFQKAAIDDLREQSKSTAETIAQSQSNTE